MNVDQRRVQRLWEFASDPGSGGSRNVHRNVPFQPPPHHATFRQKRGPYMIGRQSPSPTATVGWPEQPANPTAAASTAAGSARRMGRAGRNLNRNSVEIPRRISLKTRRRKSLNSSKIAVSLHSKHRMPWTSVRHQGWMGEVEGNLDGNRTSIPPRISLKTILRKSPNAGTSGPRPPTISAARRESRTWWAGKAGGNLDGNRTSIPPRISLKTILRKSPNTGTSGPRPPTISAARRESRTWWAGEAGGNLDCNRTSIPPRISLKTILTKSPNAGTSGPRPPAIRVARRESRTARD
jgi:hypothetical protein